MKLGFLKKHLAFVGSFLWLAILAFAVWSLHRSWAEFSLDEMDDALKAIGVGHILFALGLTAASLLCNASLDLLALRWLKKDLPKRKVISTALIASSFSMNGGGTILGGGTIRLRFYGQYGIEGPDVAKITGFLMMAGWLGHAMLAGVMLAWQPPVMPWFSESVGRMVGLLAVLSCVLLILLSATGWRGKKLRFLPPWKLTLAALAVSSLDWLFAGLALRVFVPAEVSTPMFLAATAVGQAVGAASHVPGGAGVVELSITHLLGSSVPVAQIASALLSYRLTYYLLPFVISVGVVGFREIWAKRHIAKKTLDSTTRAWSAIAPRLAGMSALAGGFVLMLSANSPMAENRRDLVEHFIPLPFVEASHFLSSIAGTVMVIVASGLLRRVRAAWWIAVTMGVVGIVFSLTKGFDWEEAIVLSIFLGSLLPFRSKFHRHASLWTRRFSFQWWGLILAIIGLSIWFGFYMWREEPYKSDLWWQYSFDNDAARFLRGMAGSALIVTFIALLQWLRPAPPRKHSEQEVDMDKVGAMVADSPRSASALALVGDKRFHFNYDKTAFLMYGDQGRTRVALADPVGDEEKFEGLYWRFAEQAQDEGMRFAFYQVSPQMVPACVEMGLSIYKIGEEAMVPLRDFSLSSSEMKKFRKVTNRMEREGWKFEIWQPDVVAQRLPELREVSDAWLSHHSAKEKGFSLGFFHDDYLLRLPCAVLLIEGKVVAFGNVWPGDGKEELSTDLMRHVPDAPNGVMDCLFIQLMLWGKEQGYQWFDLGMAPLSGLAGRQFAPLWNRIGSLIFEHGESFYNFNGLRAWKCKFQPEWRPRYIAISKAWDLPAAIIDITNLIGKASVRYHKRLAATAPEIAPDSPPSS
jgi:phosphatidylglycerol lysyltransferase